MKNNQSSNVFNPSSDRKAISLYIFERISS